MLTWYSSSHSSWSLIPAGQNLGGGWSDSESQSVSFSCSIEVAAKFHMRTAMAEQPGVVAGVISSSSSSSGGCSLHILSTNGGAIGQSCYNES